MMRGALKAQPVPALAVVLQVNPMLQANPTHHRAASRAVSDNSIPRTHGLERLHPCQACTQLLHPPTRGLPPARAHMSNALCRWEAVKAWMPDM